MSVKSKLNVFNKCLMMIGMGSIHYNGKNWTAVIYCILRTFAIYVNFRLFYDRHEWAMSLDSTMFDVMSIVVFFCLELSCIANVVSTVWRVFYDVRLSATLTRLENVHETLIRLNVVKPMTIKCNRLVAISICVHFTGCICRQIRCAILYWNFYGTFVMIEFFSQDMLPYTALYEYVLVSLYAKWTVNAINERIQQKTISVSILKMLYADVLECLRDFNRSIFGVPVLSFIGGHVADIIHGTYYNVIFFDKFVHKHYTRDQFFELYYLSTRLADLILLFSVCHATEREVNRITSVLHQRSVVETNPTVHREIKRFILQTLHERFNFELCEFYKLDYGQLLTLLSKTFAFLLVQIQFKLNKTERK